MSHNDPLQFVLNSDGRSFVGCPTHNVAIETTCPAVKETMYQDHHYLMERLAKAQAESIPLELRNEYCILFGKNILYHSKNYADAKTQYDDFISHYLGVSMYNPQRVLAPTSR